MYHTHKVHMYTVPDTIDKTSRCHALWSELLEAKPAVFLVSKLTVDSISSPFNLICAYIRTTLSTVACIYTNEATRPVKLRIKYSSKLVDFHREQNHTQSANVEPQITTKVKYIK